MVSEAFSRKVKQNVAENFDRSLELYEAFENRHRFFAEMASTLAERIRLKPHSTVLDVGCGNGISARTLNEEFFCRVVGVDLSTKMIEAGRRSCKSESIRLIVGDGERLEDVLDGQVFDYVLYNASIFIFPDVEKTIRGAVGCLRPGGGIAFSFYPFISDRAGRDLLLEAFGRLGAPPPRFRVITDYDAACRAVERFCGPVTHHRWVRPLDLGFLQDFFSIPAQSASLFPGCDYGTRQEKVKRLFAGLDDMAEEGSIVWRMAESTKPRSA
ncbi:MAG: class I SAM-dependent methyltransferase [Desulfobacterales bacterium]